MARINANESDLEAMTDVSENASGLLGLEEAAELVGVSKSTLRRLHKKKKVKFVRLGYRTVYVRRAEVLRFLSAMER